MLCFPMGSGVLPIGGLIDMGALSSASSEADFNQIRQIAPQEILKGGPPSEFQTMVANRQLETPIAMTELQFEVDGFTIVERFIDISN